MSRNDDKSASAVTYYRLNQEKSFDLDSPDGRCGANVWTMSKI